MNGKKGFLLLPGGGMSTWIWEKVIPLLDAPAITPLYRLEENNLEIRKNATIQDCVNYHRQLINDSNLEKVVVAGHSGSGALAAAIAKEIQDKICSVVYISGNLPKNHSSTIDSLPFLMRMINKFAIKSQVNTDSQPIRKKVNMIKKYYCNESDSEALEFVLSQEMLSEPLCLALEEYNFDNFPDIHQLYIVLTKDKTQTVKQQKEMMKHLNVIDKREIEGDHMVMLSKPNELANVLNEMLRSA